MGRLQLDTLATKNCPIFAPVELERLTWLENQRHVCSAATGLLCQETACLPIPHIGSDTIIGPFVAQYGQISMHLLRRALLLARFASLDL